MTAQARQGCKFDGARTLDPAALADLRWPDDPSLIPDWVFTDERIYALEQERIFRRSWVFAGATAQIPEPGDVKSLAAAMGQMVDDPEMARRCGRAGRKRVKDHFSWARHVEQYRALYERLVFADGGPG